MSRQLTSAEKRHFQTLLMKAVDGELNSDEQTEFDKFVSQDADCRNEWQQMKKLKEVTKNMNFKSLPTEVWDNYWVNVYNRLERGLAWILFSIGAIILLTYGGFKAVESIIADPQLAEIIKAAILMVIGGSVILLVSVVREKLFIRKSDPYKEIQR